jgi:hypothetical protein
MAYCHVSGCPCITTCMVLAVVAQNGLALRFASAGPGADREVVLAAVAQNGDALEYSCTRWRGRGD